MVQWCFQKLQRQYVAKPSDKLHTQLLEKERTVKTLENQFKQLTGAGDEVSLVRAHPHSLMFTDKKCSCSVLHALILIAICIGHESMVYEEQKLLILL